MLSMTKGHFTLTKLSGLSADSALGHPRMEVSHAWLSFVTAERGLHSIARHLLSEKQSFGLDI